VQPRAGGAVEVGAELVVAVSDDEAKTGSEGGRVAELSSE